MPDAAVDEAALGELLETVGGDRAFLAELVESYLADSPGLLAEMLGAAVAGDAASLRRAAHTLKSTSASLGAPGLAGACREIETRAAAGELDGLTGRIDLAATEFAAVALALRARIGAPEPA